jgi:tetratricopeptide (TPR) repeat protein
MLTTTTLSTTAPLLRRWHQFAGALAPDRLELIGTEDVVAALIDRSLLQDELDHGGDLSDAEVIRLYQADQALKAAAPALLDATNISLFKDDEPPSHWWWHIEQLVLGRASNLLLDVPAAADLKGVHPHTIRLAIKEGRLPARRLARGFLVHRRDLERWQPRRVGRPRGRHAPQGDALLDSFNAANTSGDLLGATRFALAIARDPSTPRRRLALALNAYNHEVIDEALEWSRAALEGELPVASVQTAKLVQGRALLLLNRAREAQSVLETARGVGHIDGLVSAALADANLAQGNTKKAVTLARRALAEAPDRPEMKFVLARMEWHDDRVWDALEHVVAFREARPDDPNGIVLHGAILGILGDRTADPALYRRALELLSPLARDSVEAAHTYGTALARLGRIRDAERVLRRIAREWGADETASHAADHIANAILASLSAADRLTALNVIDRVEDVRGASGLSQSMRALVEAFHGNVQETYEALGVNLSQASSLGQEQQQTIALALVQAGRATEALPFLRIIAERADDPAVIHMAVKGALAGEDLATAKVGLKRLAVNDDLPGGLANTALQLLEVGERTGRARGLFAALNRDPSLAGSPETPGGRRAAPDSQWEGLHRPVSPILDDLARSILH